VLYSNIIIINTIGYFDEKIANNYFSKFYNCMRGW
jgi:hypothetical protein